MNSEKVKYALALKFVEGVGNVIHDRLTLEFGSPRKVFEQSAGRLAQIEGVNRKTAEDIAGFKAWNRVDRELTLAYKYGVEIITADDPQYPELLRGVADRPALLYVKGKLIADEACIAVVGSRTAGTYGKFTTEKFCRELALNGLNIVSGMARGIDTAAHRGALAAKGRTIAVLGSGLDVIYPPENAKLYDGIAASGAVVSEFPFGTQPLGSNFPSRNRIISGISLGVVVMEATEKSGSLITARLALEQGREVFAVPGSIDHPGSRGTHRLIKEGAKLVENIFDIFDEINPRLKKTSPKPLEPAVQQDQVETRPNAFDGIEQSILEVLSKGPRHVDEIIFETRLGSSVILNSLLALELKGQIEQLPGKMFRKIQE